MLSTYIKYILITGFLLIFITLESNAQNYRMFDPERTRTYALAGGRYFFVEIDSVSTTGDDTTLIFKSRVDTAAISCDISTNNNDILGPKVEFVNDSIYYFYNQYLDTIKILAHPTPSTPWVAYTYPDGRYITGNFVFFAYVQIMPGTFDSMKTIRFNVYDSLGNLQPDSIPNGYNIDVTKDFGLIEFINFNNFPDDTTNYKMRGLSDPDTSVVDVDADNTFNFNLGNEFHYREVNKPDLETGADLRVSAWKYYVMSKSSTENSSTYTMERVRIDTLYFGLTPTSTVTWDTVEITYNYADYAFLDTIELSLLQHENFGFSDWVKIDTIYQGIAHKYVYDWYNNNEVDQCLENPDNIDQPEQLYGDGLGLMHYLDSTDETEYYSFDMVYFQVGLLVWGVPYDFSNLDVAIAQSEKPALFNVFPNPASDFLQLDQSLTGQPVYYEVYSMQGNWMAGAILEPDQNKIDISKLTNGIYLITFKIGDHTETHQFLKMAE